MRRSQYLSGNLATMALVVLLWQAQVRAENKSGAGEKSERKSRTKDGELLSKNRTKGQQIKKQVSSAMRRRALIYEPKFAAAAAKYKVDPRALWTIAYLETRFRANLRSPKKAKGLMQFVPGTGARFNLRDPYNADQSIEAAAQYLALLTNQFNGRLDLVLAAYNSGETTVDCYATGRTVRTRGGKVINPRGLKTGGVPPYKETQAYVRRGALVYSRVASAGVFEPELIASVRNLQVPPLTATGTEVASINSDLINLGGAPAVFNSPRTIPAIPISTSAVSSAVEQGFETVFFDVHSGARYLVKSGTIIKPLESVSEDASKGNEDRRETKSVYFVSREEQ